MIEQVNDYIDEQDGSRTVERLLVCAWAVAALVVIAAFARRCFVEPTPVPLP